MADPKGGYAFPVSWGDGTVPDFGMTLRDWFAGQALGSVLIVTAQGLNRPEPKFAGEKVSAVLAREAYAIADAMMAEREKPNAES